MSAVAHVPDWFPGAGFKAKAREWYATLQEMVDRPYQFVKDQMVGTCVEYSWQASDAF